MSRRGVESPWTPDQVAQTMAESAELVRPVLEAVIGYRQQCIDAGFNETAAERMAVHYHALLLGQS